MTTLSRDTAQRLAALAPPSLRNAAQQLLRTALVDQELQRAEEQAHVHRQQLRAGLDGLDALHGPTMREANAAAKAAGLARVAAEQAAKDAADAHAAAVGRAVAAGRAAEAKRGRLERELRDGADARLLQLEDWAALSWLQLRHHADADATSPATAALQRLRAVEAGLRQAQLMAEPWGQTTIRLKAACSELAAVVAVLAPRYQAPRIDADGRLQFQTAEQAATPAAT